MTRPKSVLGMITVVLLLLIVIVIPASTLHQTGLKGDGEVYETPSVQFPVSPTPPETPVVLISAKDSPPASQARAAFHCTGRDDQQQIESAVNSLPKSGGTVVLAAGTYLCSGDLHLAKRVRLMGMGEEQTYLTFTSPSNLEVREQNEVRDMRITGSVSLFIIESHVTVQNVTMTVDRSKAAAFYIYANNMSLEDFSFQNCTALNCETHGFLNNGEGEVRNVKFVRYNNCRSLNAGRMEQYDPWVTGFDLTESVNLFHCLVQNCTAQGAWESGFHMEDDPVKVNVVLKNCSSLQNGQKRTEVLPTFGAGFLLSGDTTAIDCISDGNLNGYLCYNGARAVRCSDYGSETSYDIVNRKDVNLIDCTSEQAGSRALRIINASDINVAGFNVSNPSGNADPIIELGSVSTRTRNILFTGSVNCAATSRQIRIINGNEIRLSGDLTTAAEQAVSIEGDATDGVYFSNLVIASTSSSSDAAGVQVSPQVSNADTIRIEESVIMAASPSQGLAYGVMNRAAPQVKVKRGLTFDVVVPYYNCEVLGGPGLIPGYFS